MQTWFSVQLGFAKFLSKIKGNFLGSALSMILALYLKFPFILDKNLAKANCRENHVCTSCDTVVLVSSTKVLGGSFPVVHFVPLFPAHPEARVLPSRGRSRGWGVAKPRGPRALARPCHHQLLCQGNPWMVGVIVYILILLFFVFAKFNFEKRIFLDVLWIPTWTKTRLFPLNSVIILWSKKYWKSVII